MTAKTAFGMNRGLLHTYGNQPGPSMTDTEVVANQDVAPVSEVLPPVTALPTTSSAAFPKLQIGWLSTAVSGARSAIADLKTNIPQLAEEAAALNKTVADIRQHISQTHDDLKFEAGLGNGAPTSGG